MKSTGWIKIDKSILKWEWYKNETVKSVFLHCLLSANWQDGRFEGVEVPRGSFITSIGHIAEETGLSIKKVRTALEHLEKSGELGKVSTSRYTLIIVKKFDLYQGDRANKGQTEGKQRANKGQQYKNIKNNKNNIYSGQRIYDYDEMQKRLANK